MGTDDYKRLKWYLKYLPAMAAALMMFDVFLLLYGIDINYVVEIVAGFSYIGVVLLWKESYVLGFCWLYRAFVIYDFIVYSFIIYQRVFGFGSMLIPMRCLALFIGIILFIIFIFRVR